MTALLLELVTADGNETVNINSKDLTVVKSCAGY